MSKKIIAIDEESFNKLKLFKLKHKEDKKRNITYGEILARIIAVADYDKAIK